MEIRARHNGKTWESLVDNNVWELGAKGTEILWKKYRRTITSGICRR